MSAEPITISSDSQLDIDVEMDSEASDSQSDDGSFCAGSAATTQLGNKRSSAPAPQVNRKKPKRKSL
jgi:hypothetical protein